MLKLTNNATLLAVIRSFIRETAVASLDYTSKVLCGRKFDLVKRFIRVAGKLNLGKCFHYVKGNNRNFP